MEVLQPQQPSKPLPQYSQALIYETILEMAKKYRDPPIKPRELLPEELDILVETLGRHHGKIFGGLARNYVCGSLKCRDIDLWFQTDSDRDEFVKDFTEREQFNYPFKNYQVDSQSPNYPFSRTIGQWVRRFGDINVDLVVCEHLPVNDFTINLLSIDGAKNVVCENPAYTLERVVDDIKHYRYEILSPYLKLFFSPYPRDSLTARLRMLKFLKYGYCPYLLNKEEDCH